MLQVNFYSAGVKIKNKDMLAIPREEDKVCIEGTCYKIKSIIWREEGIDHYDVVEIHLDGEAYIEDTIPHGIRSNNPGNLKRDPNNEIPWDGLADYQSGSFYRFKTPEYGIRAMIKVLNTYNNKHLLNSVSSIIYRWAPPSENDTEAYVKFVSNRLGVSPKQPLVLSNVNVLIDLIEAIIYYENGNNPYDRAVVLRAIDLV